jgi:hypothetical protein
LACDLHKCAAGTIDDDLAANTSCLVCPPGAFVPEGQVGSCRAFLCLPGFYDDDDDPATICLPQDLAVKKNGTDTTLAVVLAALVMVFFVRQRRRRQRRELQKPFSFKDELIELQARGLLSYEDTEQTRTPREIPRSCITMLGKIGEGAFGDVYKGVIDESKQRGIPRFMVAIKVKKI